MRGDATATATRAAYGDDGFSRSVPMALARAERCARGFFLGECPHAPGMRWFSSKAGAYCRRRNPRGVAQAPRLGVFRAERSLRSAGRFPDRLEAERTERRRGAFDYQAKHPRRDGVPGLPPGVAEREDEKECAHENAQA